MLNRYIALLTILYCNFNLTSCKKYLDVKSDQSLVIPTTIQDLQSLLDNYIPVNNLDPSAAEVSSDDYYLTDNDWDNQVEFERRMYTWEKENLFSTTISTDWDFCYGNVYRANVVLDNIDKVKRTPNDTNDWNNTKGFALFLRAKAFFQAAVIWTLAYDHTTASKDLGLPLRLDPDFNKPSVRANLQETYDQIVADLAEAIRLLPVIPLHEIRPSKPAAYALMARVFLAMRNYDKAGLYADSALQLRRQLMDYNNDPSIDPSKFYPIAEFNSEVIMSSYPGSSGGPLFVARIDSTLFQSYSDDDLRKTIFFQDMGDGSYGLRGTYASNGYSFTGIATDELFLIRSECYARAGDISRALNDLNTLLIKRWKTGTFVPITATHANDALNKILLERRKELIFRSLRWIDIRRFNKEGANLTLKRLLKGQEYILPPNDLRYALPIPDDVISLSGMPQNPR